MTTSTTRGVGLAEALVDLDAVAHNVALFAERTNAQVMAVVKADAFGHGAVAVATAALRAGASWLGSRPTPRRFSCAETESARRF